MKKFKFWHLRSLERRIVALFLLLIVVVQVTGFIAIRIGIDANARVAIQDELLLGERVFMRLMDQHSQKLTQDAMVLASDYGFRQAMSTGDDATISSALANHRNRIGASISALISTERKIQAVSTQVKIDGMENDLFSMLSRAEIAGSAAGIVRGSDNQPYQIVIVPIKAPLIVGWVVMGFPIDKKLITEMYDLSSLGVTVLTKVGSTWAPNVSTNNTDVAQKLVSAIPDNPKENAFLSIFQLDTEDISARLIRLTAESGQPSIVILQKSLNGDVSSYRRLQGTLLVLAIIGIILAASGSVFIARRITEPLRRLADLAKRLGDGDYSTKISMPRDDEIGSLASAFEAMQVGIVKREEDVRRLAFWDSLTNLPNRAQFTNLLNTAIKDANEKNCGCCVLMLDLDRFKHVNDMLGHEVGDMLLKELAHRLKGHVHRSDDNLARLGGDEFAILLPESNLASAQLVAARIMKALEIPISLAEHTIDMGAGIGIAAYPIHGTDAQSLLSRAEIAMYAAKERGNEAVIYDPALDKSSQQSLSMLSELRKAVDNNEFRLHIQPKMNLKTGEIVGVEALVRWQHPEKGFLFPDQFIPFAEQTGFIRVLTLWVLEQAAINCRIWSKKGLHFKMSVNLSTRDLMDINLAEKFKDLLHRNEVDASAFCLEITESAIMDDPVRASKTLDQLHAMGVDLAIDDFGTGYSSLAYLKQLPVDELKIDKSFVLNMEKNSGDEKIVRSTIDLGHNMGLRVVAEGIETLVAWEMLNKMGCDQGQGYFMSKPMPVEKFEGWLTTWQPPYSCSANEVE